MPGRQQIPSFQLPSGTTDERDGSYNLTTVGNIFYNTDTSNVEILHVDPSNSLDWRDLVVNNKEQIDISGNLTVNSFLKSPIVMTIVPAALTAYTTYTNSFYRVHKFMYDSPFTTHEINVTTPGWVHYIAVGGGGAGVNQYWEGGGGGGGGVISGTRYLGVTDLTNFYEVKVGVGGEKAGSNGGTPTSAVSSWIRGPGIPTQNETNGSTWEPSAIHAFKGSHAKETLIFSAATTIATSSTVYTVYYPFIGSTGGHGKESHRDTQDNRTGGTSSLTSGRSTGLHQGYPGGLGRYQGYTANSSAGGGGAGGSGQNADAMIGGYFFGGEGGPGKKFTNLGADDETIILGGGGGGSSDNYGSHYRVGGAGGGGSGAVNNNQAHTSGIADTGGGGGGGRDNAPDRGGDGGSGVVYIYYPK